VEAQKKPAGKIPTGFFLSFILKFQNNCPQEKTKNQSSKFKVSKINIFRSNHNKNVKFAKSTKASFHLAQIKILL